MANTRTITAANAVLMLGVTGLYDVPKQIQGFTADDVTDLDALTVGETSMGVDGRLSAGFVHAPVAQSIMLKADSLSNDMFDNWAQAEQHAGEKYVAFGSILLKATGHRYTMTRGFLQSTTIMPGVGKTLKDRKFQLVWERVYASPA